MSREYIAICYDNDMAYYYKENTLWVRNCRSNFECSSCYSTIKKAIETENFGRSVWTCDPKEINKYLMTWELMK